MDEAAVRRDYDEALAVAVGTLTDGSNPPAAQVVRLQGALRGHVRTLVDMVGEDFADAQPGRLQVKIIETLALAKDVLAQPVRGGVRDRLALPQIARLLMLMHTERGVFAAAPELPVFASHRASKGRETDRG
ncbi:hypothetical protein [Streptomyces sp. NPDC093149]|uniref:hypothetical protein n=1 Tax=Streptomyces sp. NPDC093149 TaxID=3366031 RepID=UPI0038236AAB